MPEKVGDGLVYACFCGFTAPDQPSFSKHMSWGYHHDGGKESHHSLGKVDPSTGEVILPPVKQRKWEDRVRLKEYGKKGGDGKDGGAATPAKVQQTTNPALASEIQFTPQILRCPYTPIMRVGQEVAIRLWGWSPETPLADFLDTIIFKFFEDRDIELLSFRIKEDDNAGSQ